MTNEQIKPFVRDDGWWRCAVCHGSGHDGSIEKFRKPCGNCKGAGYKPPEPYTATNVYHMR